MDNIEKLGEQKIRKRGEQVQEEGKKGGRGEGNG